MRIISVVPSLTELLFDLGLQNEIVGITRFCIHPKQKNNKVTKVGGTKSLKLDRIFQLEPDIIIANKEENAQEDIEYLKKHFDVLLTDIFTLEQALESILEIGRRTNVIFKAKLLVEEIRMEFKHLKPFSKSKNKVAYFIWDNPMMISGRNTFINNILEILGFENLDTNVASRYPELTNQKIIEGKPDFLFLSSEPFPFKEKQKLEFESRFPKMQVVLVDGEMFSWYGSRLKLAPKYFNQLIQELT